MNRHNTLSSPQVLSYDYNLLVVLCTFLLYRAFDSFESIPEVINVPLAS